MRKAILRVALSSILALSISAANEPIIVKAPPSSEQSSAQTAFQTYFNLSTSEIKSLIDKARQNKILTLQTWLRIAGFYPPSLKIDGQTGPTTRAAFGEYQKTLGLTPDGIPHANWEGPLESVVREKVQKQLSLLDFYTGDIDGVNGRATEDAIKRYEKSIQIPETGTLSPFMLFHLFNPAFLPQKVAISTPEAIKTIESKPLNTEKTLVITKSDNAPSETQPHTDSQTTIVAEIAEPISAIEAPSNLLESQKSSDIDEAFILLPPLPEAVAELQQEAVEIAKQRAKEAAIAAKIAAEKQAELDKVKNLIQLDEPIKPFALSQSEVDNLVIKARRPNTFFTQTALALLDLYDGPLDGSTGPATRDAIRAFEKAIGQPETGKLLPRWENPLRQIMYRLVQTRLKQDGFYQGDIDGLGGASTRNAIKAYEEASNTEAVGQLTPALLLTLFNSSIENNIATNHHSEDIPSDSPEDVTEDGTKPVSSEEDQELQADSNKDEERYRASVSAFDLSHAKSNEETALTQLQLAYLGFYKGKVDGVPGPGTTRAITAFQKEFALPQSGKFDQRTRAALEVENINKFQRYLQRTGYMKDKPTGTWGPKTRRAVGILKNRYGYQVSDKLDIPAYLILIDEEQGSKFAKTYYETVIKEREAAAAVQDTQAYLIGFGILNGKADGKMGPATQGAISTYRSQQGLRKGNQIDTALLESFKKVAPKQAQAYLQQLGYPIKPDGIFGNNSKKQLNAFLTKNKKPQSDIVTAEILMTLKLAVNTKLANERNQASTQRQSSKQTANTSGAKTGVAPRLQKGLQQNAAIGNAPKGTVNGKLQIMRNNAGNVVGCKVNNIQMAADWCTGKRNGQSCRVLYKNGRVLSMSCR